MLFVERVFKFTFPQMLNEFPDGQEPPTVLCILNINTVILLARVSYSTLYFCILMSFWHPKGFTVIYHQGMDLGSHTLSMVCYLNCMYDLCFCYSTCISLSRVSSPRLTCILQSNSSIRLAVISSQLLLPSYGYTVLTTHRFITTCLT